MYVFKRQMLISWNIVLRSVSKTGRFDVLQRAKHLPEFVLYKSSSRGIKKPLKSLFPSSTWYLSLVNSFLGVTKIFTVGGIAVVNFKKKKKRNPRNLILSPLYIIISISSSRKYFNRDRVRESCSRKRKRKKIVSSRCHLHPKKKDPWNEAQWLKSDSNRHVGGTSLLPIAHWSSPALGCQRIERAFPVEFFHHSIIPVAREGGDSPPNRPIEGYRGISVGGATVGGDGSPGPARRPRGGAWRGPRGRLVGGLTSTTVHFPRALGTPAASCQPPLFARSLRPPPPPPPPPTPSSLFPRRPREKGLDIETKRSPLPRILFQETDSRWSAFSRGRADWHTTRSLFLSFSLFRPGRQRLIIIYCHFWSAR